MKTVQKYRLHQRNTTKSLFLKNLEKGPRGHSHDLKLFKAFEIISDINNVLLIFY